MIFAAPLPKTMRTGTLTYPRASTSLRQEYYQATRCVGSIYELTHMRLTNAPSVNGSGLHSYNEVLVQLERAEDRLERNARVDRAGRFSTEDAIAQGTHYGLFAPRLRQATLLGRSLLALFNLVMPAPILPAELRSSRIVHNLANTGACIDMYYRAHQIDGLWRIERIHIKSGKVQNVDHLKHDLTDRQMLNQMWAYERSLELQAQGSKNACLTREKGEQYFADWLEPIANRIIAARASKMGNMVK